MTVGVRGLVLDRLETDLARRMASACSGLGDGARDEIADSVDEAWGKDGVRRCAGVPFDRGLGPLPAEEGGALRKREIPLEGREGV